MVHGLAGIVAAVGDNAEAIRKPLVFRDLGGGGEDIGGDPRLFSDELARVREVLLRHDEDVGGRLRIYIPEGVDLIVFVNLCRRDLAGDDPAEQTIHNISPFHNTPQKRVRSISHGGERLVELRRVADAGHGAVGSAAASAAADRGELLDDGAGVRALLDGLGAADDGHDGLAAVFAVGRVISSNIHTIQAEMGQRT